ncbi:hypothetical protein Taro_002845 [Colocasia esculenta]|uniref:Trichome birefringence-like C-terminal domain-containing protein n=1 Tax=Colocasia esculenta TaxID=4460 RepID=A0A843TM39_COLES|nr:hypothetical protein [Colocasia esculenta]
MITLQGHPEKLRGKRLMFAGDSLQRGQWLSFVCTVESLLPSHDKSMKRSRSLSIFTTKVQIFH